MSHFKGNKKEKKSLVTIEKNSYVYENEIDYNKLAEAVVYAQQKAMQVDSPTSKILATLVSLVFWVSSIAGFVVAVAFVIGGEIELFSNPQYEMRVKIFGIPFVFLVGLVLVLLSLMLSKSAKELESEKDRQFVVSLFSAFASFCAMILALISLFKH